MVVTEQLEATALEIARVFGGVAKDSAEWDRCLHVAETILSGKTPLVEMRRSFAALAFEKAAEFNRNFPIGTDGTIDGRPTRVEKDALVFPHARHGETVMAWFAGLGWKEIDGFKKAEQAVTLAQELVGIGKQAQNQGKIELAEHLYRAAIGADPDYWHTYNELGALYNFTERHEQAIHEYTKALNYAPHSGEILSNRAMSYRAIGKPLLALTDCKEALRWLPGHSLISLNMAGVMDDLNMVDDCLEIVRDHVRRNPENPNVQYNLALLLLSDGRFDEGWEQYDWRLKQPTASAHYEHFDIPRWRGEDLTGKSILIWAEQGLGDEIMTASMFGDVMSRAAQVTVFASRRLVPLFKRSFPDMKVMQRCDNTRPEAYRRERLPEYMLPLDFDAKNYNFQASQADLGRYLRRSFGSFPRRQFLAADKERVAAHVAELRARAPEARFFVGISWNSHRNIRIGKLKGVKLSQFLPILQTPGIAFVNLQYGDTTGERAEIEREYGIKILDLGVDPLSDMDEFAAVTAAVDAVVTVSNTAAHVSGALGIKTFVLTPEGPGRLWYHFRRLYYSPWYYDVTLIRQTASSLWAEAIEHTKILLSEL